MGNCFGRESSASDAFVQPGRTLGSTPAAPAPRASVPSKSSRPEQPAGNNTLGNSNAPDARRAAALAAEERAVRANQSKGKLGQALAKGKQQTRTDILSEVSRDEQRKRDADEGAEARNWN